MRTDAHSVSSYGVFRWTGNCSWFPGLRGSSCCGSMYFGVMLHYNSLTQRAAHQIMIFPIQEA